MCGSFLTRRICCLPQSQLPSLLAPPAPQVALHNTSVAANRAPSGGGLAITSSVSVLVSTSTFERNEAFAGSGGAIEVGSPGGDAVLA